MPIMDGYFSSYSCFQWLNEFYTMRTRLYCLCFLLKNKKKHIQRKDKSGETSARSRLPQQPGVFCITVSFGIAVVVACCRRL